jgi:hypothetical protein
MIICFHEKHDNRYVEGGSRMAILAHVLKQRIAEGYWYDEDQEQAQFALDTDRAERWMTERRRCEYEDWSVISVEKI